MTSSVRFHISNRLEHLVQAMADMLSTPISGALAKECVVVQGRGMALWLSMQLSRDLGVWSNAEFLYPRNFVERMFERTLDPPLDGISGLARYRPEELTWTVYDLLPSLLTTPAFNPLKGYIGDDPSGVRSYELASQIARTFDEYLTFRPEILRAWQGDEDQGDLFSHAWGSVHLVWQERLWRAVVQRLGPSHLAAQELEFSRLLEKKRRPKDLPERISVFGLSSLPPLYLRVLGALSHHCDVQVFAIVPTPEGFGADQDSLAWAKELRVQGSQREIISHHDSSFEQSLLGTLQRHLGAELPRGTVANDGSIALHSCHSPMREVEVLHDNVLELLEQGVAPDEIIVMMPNVDDYAPLIQAVFDRPQNKEAVPYRISDRKPQGDNPVLEAFARLLLLADRRLSASEVLDLLALRPVHERFEIREVELQRVAQWIVASGARWGLDADHKQQFDMPKETQHSWRFGLDRLVLGYATSGGDGQAIGEFVPWGEIEGSSGVLLGQVAAYIEALRQVVTRLREPKTAKEWQAALSSALTALIAASGDYAWQHVRVRQTLAALGTAAETANLDRPLSFQVVRRWLEQAFEREREARGFLAGGVNFCAFVPMRSIPFKIVVLLGMSERAFPRSTRRPDFSVLGQRDKARPGDPDRRTEDRQLFLEAVMSAREKLMISFVGQSIKDNTESSPSVLVSELLDALEQLGAGSAKALVTRHPLQPFSARYYDNSDARLFSYERGYMLGAARALTDRAKPKPLLCSELEVPEVSGERTLQQLVDYFRDPARYLFTQRLQVQRREDFLEIPDREPVELDGLEDYAIGDRALGWLRSGISTERALQLMQLTGSLPGGAHGQVAFEDLLRSLLPMRSALTALTRGGALPAIGYRARFGATTVRGAIDNLYPTGRVEVRFSRSAAKHQLGAWIVHLALCHAEPASLPQASTQIARAPKDEGAALIHFKPVREAGNILQDLLLLFERGQLEALPLFPDTSLTFVTQLRAGKSEDEALKAAHQEWPKERAKSDALVRLYGPDSELTLEGPTEAGYRSTSFATLARRVFEPLLDHAQSTSLSAGSHAEF
jgi:exodeoxyribonuclease V gamma subunit